MLRIPESILYIVYLGVIVYFDHEDTVTDVKGIHILLQGLHCICPQNVSPSFVAERALEPCVKTLQQNLNLNRLLSAMLARSMSASCPSKRLAQPSQRFRFARMC